MKTDVGEGGRGGERAEITFSIQQWHVDVSSAHTEQYLAERDRMMKYIASVFIKINGQVTSLRKRPHAITRKLYGKARSPGHEVMMTVIKLKSQVNKRKGKK